MSEKNALDYDVIKPKNRDWWKPGEQMEFDILYSIQLSDGSIKEIKKYDKDGEIQTIDSFDSLYTDTENGV